MVRLIILFRFKTFGSVHDSECYTEGGWNGNMDSLLWLFKSVLWYFCTFKSALTFESSVSEGMNVCDMVEKSEVIRFPFNSSEKISLNAMSIGTISKISSVCGQTLC